jgi:hypothetical protein
MLERQAAAMVAAGPAWNGDTARLPVQRSSPLLTPGQLARTGQQDRARPS